MYILYTHINVYINIYTYAFKQRTDSIACHKTN